jgi:hypothetical protein
VRKPREVAVNRGMEGDPEWAATVAAEESTRELFLGTAVDERILLRPDEVERLAVLTLEAVGFTGDPPIFIFDVPDTDWRNGWYENGLGLVHLHPERITRWVVLHEMAHWLDPAAKPAVGTVVKVIHGQSFRTIHCDLVRYALCEDDLLRDEVARTLSAMYGDSKVPIATDYARPWQ